jgi:hypothetical protein
MINTLTLIPGFGFLIYSGRRGLVYYLSEILGVGNVTKMHMDTCIRTRKIIKCSVLIDSYLHHVYFHARDYFTKRQSTLTFRGIYVVGIETFICAYGKLLVSLMYIN